MANDVHNRVALAIEQLHVAIDLFFMCTSDASVITLAGAADEVLARKATRFGQPQVLEAKHALLVSALGKIGRKPKNLGQMRHEENAIKNLLKHLDPTDEEKFEASLEAEAVRKISSACGNFERCGLPLTDKMAEFRGWYLSQEPRKNT